MRLTLLGVLAVIAIAALATYTWLDSQSKSGEKSAEDSAETAVVEPAKDVIPTDSLIASKQGRFQGIFRLEDPETGHQELWLTLKSAEGQPVKGAEVQAEPWMPEHRHGSPTDPVVEEREPGVYRVYPLDFTMPGLWQVRLEIKAGGRTDSLIPAFSIE